MYKKILSIAAVSTLVFTGCSDSSSGSHDSGGDVTYQKINGIVSDPSIEKAFVKVCKKTDVTNCLQYNTGTTDENGSFSITEIDSDVELNDYVIIANGGKDTQTGEDFGDLNLTIPGSFGKNGSSIAITPITSLMFANDWNKSQLATNIGLTEEEVLKDPTTSSKLQRKALQLTNIAKKRGKGFKEFAITGGNLATFVANDNSLSDADKEELDLTIKYLDENSNSVTTNEVITKFSAIRTVFGSDTYKDANKSDSNTFKNIKKWSEKIVKATKGAGITKTNIAQIQAVFAKTPDLNLSDENLVVADINISDISLADIRPEGVLINHKIALSKALGADADTTGKKMRDYYFGSTVSKTKQVEDLIKPINDVSITDEIYVSLAQEHIKNNNIKKALNYANLNISLKNNQADVYRLAGKKLAASDSIQGEKLLDKAFELYKTVINAKGKGKMADSDIQDLANLFLAYTLNSNTAKAAAVESYMLEKRSEYSISSSYTKFANAYRKAADSLIEKGSISEAISLLKKDYSLIKDLPSSPKGDYMLRILYHMQIAERLAENGEFETSVEITDKAQSLRLDDKNSTNGVFTADENDSVLNTNDTGYKTDSYVKQMLKVYVLAGEISKAESLIPTIVRDKFKADLYAQYAKGLALNDIDAALQFVKTNILDTSTGHLGFIKGINAYTYTRENEKFDLIAQSLINKGETTKAKKAIDKAAELLDQTVSSADISDPITEISSNWGKEAPHYNNSNKYIAGFYIRSGYAKIAKLYGKINENSLADVYFTKALNLIENNITGDLEKIQSYSGRWNGMVEAYDAIGLNDKAKLMMEKSYDVAKTAEDRGDTISDVLALYSEILSTTSYKVSPDTIKAIANQMKSMIDNSGSDIGEGSSNENNKAIVDYLIKIADKLENTGHSSKAENILNSAIKFTNAIVVPTEKVEYKEKIALGYANIGLVNKSSDLINTIPYKGDRRNVIKELAKNIAKKDDFPSIYIASVDTDGDGKPDFFDLGATQEQITASGLTLDEDIDGDNILNQDDKRPFFPDN